MSRWNAVATCSYTSTEWGSPSTELAQVQTTEQLVKTKTAVIELIYCDCSQIESMKPKLDEQWSDLCQLPGIQQFQCMQVVRPHVICAKKLTKSKDILVHYITVDSGTVASTVQVTDNNEESEESSVLVHDQWTVAQCVNERCIKCPNTLDIS